MNRLPKLLLLVVLVLAGCEHPEWEPDEEPQRPDDTLIVVLRPPSWGDDVTIHLGR